MLTKRVIPCLDVTGGRVVKGTKFLALRDAGDPVESALAYNDQGADELVFLDITASSDDRRTMLDVVARTADQCFMPLTVGGGVRTAVDVRNLLIPRADKVSVNTPPRKRRSTAAEAASPPAVAPSIGPVKPWTAVRAKSCSPAWTPTAPRPATTWS